MGLAQRHGEQGKSEDFLKASKQYDEWSKNQTGITKAANEVLFRPAASQLYREFKDVQAIFHGIGAGIEGTKAAIAQIGTEVGQEKLGKEVAAGFEAFPSGFRQPAGTFPRMTAADYIREVERAKDLKTVGAGEAGYQGTADVPAPALKEVAPIVREEAATSPPVEAAPISAGSVVSTTPVTAADLRSGRASGETAHHMSRAAIEEPEPYHAFTRMADALPDDVNERFQVHGLLAGDVDKNLVNLLQSGIDPNREFHSGAPRGGTNGVDSTRTFGSPYLLISDDGKTLRETGVKNVVAVGPAEANIPALKASFPDVNFMTVSEAEAFMKSGEVPARVPVEQPARVTSAPIDESHPIAQDVAGRLVKAGRPADEAAASAQIIAAHYETRAARFGGALGTAEELYKREGADIRGPGGRPTGAEADPVPANNGPRGRAAADPQSWSLLEFLASEGGLKPTADLEAVFGNKKGPFVPGFGPLLRKGGLTMDEALTRAKENSYVLDPNDIQHTPDVTNAARGEKTVRWQDLQDRIAEEAGGRKQYRTTREEPVAKINPDEEAGHIKDALYREVEATGGSVKDIDPVTADRVVELIQKGEASDVMGAYERAVMEVEYNQKQGPQSPEFKRWFGESKVVDEAGEPRVVYHGTTADFSEFDAAKGGAATGAKSAEKGFFFSSDPEVASSYAVGTNRAGQARQNPLQRRRQARHNPVQGRQRVHLHPRNRPPLAGRVNEGRQAREGPNRSDR
jgi:hypothetical protein